MILAKLDPSTENLHEWRKQVKYLFYEFQVLRPVFTEELTIYESKLDKLADYLGEDHDLAELGDCLRCNPYIFIEANRLELLNSIINKSRQEKQNALFTFADDIFNEKLNNITDHLLSD
jgi:CHAD domain-containing protein